MHEAKDTGDGGKSECRAQPLWRSSPGASMSVYQTAFWDRDVTAPGRTHADDLKQLMPSSMA